MFALPFVFTLFVINFPAGLLLYWITTNTWTIGQQLLVRKLYPKPEPIEANDDDDKPAPARGKPPVREEGRRGGRRQEGRQEGEAARHPQARRRGEGHGRRRQRSGRQRREDLQAARFAAQEAQALRPPAMSEPAERMRDLVATVCDGIGIEGFSVEVSESDEELRVTVDGEDLGLLIGKHGATIDALQHLALRAAFQGQPDQRRVVVDAAGYRDRREAALHRAADRAVTEALDFGRAVELEPMRPAERKIVHLYLRERTEVETHSEGDEPERRLVVTPLQRDA